jgi:hypothetical protein
MASSRLLAETLLAGATVAFEEGVTDLDLWDRFDVTIMNCSNLLECAAQPR